MKKISLFLSILVIISNMNLDGQINQNCSGNVGIGTNSPSNDQGWNKVLDVRGTNHSKILATTTSSSVKTGIFSHYNYWASAPGGIIGTESNHNLYFITNYSIKARIATNGVFTSYSKIGIGEENPYSDLELANNKWIMLNAITDNTKSGISFYETGNKSRTDVEYGARIYYHEGHDGLYLETKQQSISNLGIFINRAYGRVGIKKNNPSYALDVNGSIRYSGSIIPSDSRLKKNIVQIGNDNEKIKNLQMLDAISYTPISPDAEKFKNVNDTLSTEVKERQKKRFERTQYGFDASLMQQYFPELVSEDDEGFLGVDYISLIPLIIEAYKEQQIIIEGLENKIAGLMTDNSNLKSTSNSETENESALLFQNTPNPFSENTEIKYFLPDYINKAMINIYNMNGTQLKSIELHQKGDGSITINGSAFNAGMYMYTLIANGQVIDTKQMILTD